MPLTSIRLINAPCTLLIYWLLPSRSHSRTLAKATDDVRTDLLLSRIAPARRSPTKPPMSPRASVLVTHRNSRVCRNEAERVQMAWRSSSMRCSRRRHAACSESADAYLPKPCPEPVARVPELDMGVSD